MPPPLPTTLPLETLGEAVFFRIIKTGHGASEPRFKKSGSNRFDAPDQGFGTLYCAHDFKTCFLETLVRDSSSLCIKKSDFDTRSVLFLLLNTSQLRLVPVHGDAAIQMRLNPSDVAGKDYAYTQALAKSIQDHHDAPDGLVYRSRFDDVKRAVVLFERAEKHVRRFPQSSPVEFKDVRELCDAVRTTVPYRLVS